MPARSTLELLHLPVRLRGIRLGHPVDVLVDSAEWRALGFVVLCGDELQRFLPYAATTPEAEQVRVDSALMLLEDVSFYRSRAASLRDLLGGEVVRGDEHRGLLRDLLVGGDGAVVELVVEHDGREETLAPAGVVVAAAP